MTVLQKKEDSGTIMESVIIKGDLSKLTPQERSEYYMRVCESVGLNPLTKPFEYITLNGRLTLYALRACTDQLRTIHDVSVEELSESERDGVFIVTAKVRNGSGRTDMAKGAVTIGNLKGDALANALMKAETKAKRRATLSLCGLGFLDEMEIESIPLQSRGDGNGQQAPVKLQVVETPTHDPETGEVGPHPIAWPEPGKVSQPIAWGIVFTRAVRESKSLEELDQWEKLNFEPLDRVRNEAIQVFERIIVNINDTRLRLYNEQPNLEVRDAGP